MGKKVKIGNDRLPAPVISENVPLYNLTTGQPLTDEGGTALVSAEDTFLTSETTSLKSTSLVYTDDITYRDFKNEKLTGKNFSANGVTISAAEGTGLFKGQTRYKIIFSAAQTITSLSVGTIITNTRTNFSGEVIFLSLNTNNLSGFLIIDGYESTLFSGDEFKYSGTETITSIEAKFVGKSGEVQGGDRLLLPTGLKIFGDTFTTYSSTTTYSSGDIVVSGASYYYVLVNITAGNIPTVITDQSKFLKMSPIGSQVSGKYLVNSVDGNSITYSSKIYENRTVKRVIDNDTLELKLEVTSDVDLFEDLILVKTITVDPTLKIEEQFSTFSEVSTTILGYPKAEQQLSLFSNVSTYGLDEDEFIFYAADDASGQPNVWTTRKNKTYGNHYNSRIREVGDEGAIALESYRTPYSYPYGPTGISGYQQTNYKKYNTFLKLGALLYDYYKETDPSYANNFLPYIPNHALTNATSFTAGPNAPKDSLGKYINFFIVGEQIKVNDGSEEVLGTVKGFNMTTLVLHLNEDIGFLLKDRLLVTLPIIGVSSGSTADIVDNLTFSEDEFFATSMLTPLNPYYSEEEDFFSQIDTWTETYRKILKGDIKRPNNGSPLDASFIQNLSLIQEFIINSIDIIGTVASNDNSRPGYSTAIATRGYLESRKAFRYQPGRISGYTFGVRASNDARDDNNVIIEWGIGNDTDDLVFQIRGSTFSIVRRSVVPLSEDVLVANSLEVSDQVLITKDTRNNTVFNGLENKEVYETVISRDRWNGDKLDGNGPSSYLWKAENVTMYKIEFGWYGAIGVQFYAYVPVENGEARWVKLHRLIIENKLKQPCMGDPYYKFKYSLVIDNFINVKTPQYIYKYGTSCFIDGGDEGTLKIYSATSQPKTAPLELGEAQLSTSLISLQPKTAIFNSLGTAIKNKKQIFPKQLSVQSSGLTEVTIVKCKSCPGYGHTYQPNLTAGYQGDERLFAYPSVVDGYNREQLTLQLLTREITASDGFTITLNNVDFIREGDIVDPSGIIQGIPDETLITNVNKNTKVITLNKAITESVSGSLEIQPVFLKRDLYSKIIAFRFYLTYVYKFESSSLRNFVGQEERYLTIQMGTISEAGGIQTLDLDRYLDDRQIPINYRSGRNTQSMPTEFPGRLSSYKALAASGTPVIGRKNSLLFLMTERSDVGSYSSGQYADFRIGVTSLRPQDDGNGGIEWYNPGGVLTEFTDDYKLFAERFNEGISIDIDGLEGGETNFASQQPFSVDYRIVAPPGSNSGLCAFLNITVDSAEFIQVQQFKGTNLPQGDISDPENGGYTSFDPNKYYLRSVFFPFTFNPKNAEIGFDSTNPTQSEVAPAVGSGIQFTSDIITYTDTSSNLSYKLIEISNNLPGQPQAEGTSLVIWYIPINLETYRKLATKSFNFNPFPLYFFVEMKDGAGLNGAVIKEVGQFTNTYNPKWMVTGGMTVSNSGILVGPTDNLISTTGGLTQAPPNFIDKERLSSALIDTQNESQLRPYEIIDKIYVGQDTKSISLDTIFDRDKETITPDLLNTTAYFFLATSKETDPTNPRSIQATLTYVEQ
jgi:hypothetical protein